MIEVKKSNIHLSRSILTDKAAIIKKEKLLSELNNEIKHFKKENERLKDDLEHTEKVKAKCEENEKGVKEYCNTLRGKFKNFVETIDMYEKTIKELKVEEENIIKTNEEKISKLNKSKKQFNEEISGLNKKAEHQQSTIRELENNIDSLLKKKEDQKNRYHEKEKQDKRTYNELLKKYNELHKRVSDFKNNEETKEHEINNAQNLMSNHISAKEDLEIKLFEYQQQNAILSQQVKDLSSRLTGMSSATTVETEKKFSKTNYKSARMTSSTTSKSVDFKSMK